MDGTLELGNLFQADFKTIVIHNVVGQEYWLNLVGGKLETGGDLPMTEAAEIFFKEVKRIADLSR